MDDNDDVNSGDDDDDDVLYDDANSSSDDCRAASCHLPTLTSSFHQDQYQLYDGSLSMV